MVVHDLQWVMMTLIAIRGRSWQWLLLLVGFHDGFYWLTVAEDGP